jgi:hypothetical protein
LKVNNDHEDEEGGKQVHHIWQILTIKGLLQRPRLVTPSEQQMEKTNYGALKLWTAASVYSGGRKCLPDNILANIRGNKEGDSRADTVALLKHFIEENDNHAGCAELEDQENDDSPTKVRRAAVDSCGNVYNSLTECQNQGKYWGILAYVWG